MFVPAPLLTEDFVYGPAKPPPPPEPVFSDAVLCNCWAYTKERHPALPSTKTIWANLTDEISDVAVFDYDGVPHYAVVEQVHGDTFTISETNYRRCQAGVREISIDDPRLVGFYQVQ